jgi:hypothetical protein
LFKELKFKVGAEIGVERGGYSKVLCEANPGVKLYCVDPWLAYSEYTDHVKQSKLDGFYDEAKERLKDFNCAIIKKTSMDAVRTFKDNFLDFVYIDGNHRLENAIEDIVFWSKKVKPGGIISGHDFIRYSYQRNNHVVEAVTAYTLSYRIVPWFVLGTKKIIPGEVRDHCRSFMWVKKE